jgi:hypothetical protein
MLRPRRRREIAPVAITVPGRCVSSPEHGPGAYRNLIYFHEVDQGGHFAAWEQPSSVPNSCRVPIASIIATRLRIVSIEYL